MSRYTRQNAAGYLKIPYDKKLIDPDTILNWSRALSIFWIILLGWLPLDVETSRRRENVLRTTFSKLDFVSNFWTGEVKSSKSIVLNAIGCEIRSSNSLASTVKSLTEKQNCGSDSNWVTLFMESFLTSLLRMLRQLFSIQIRFILVGWPIKDCQRWRISCSGWSPNIS